MGVEALAQLPGANVTGTWAPWTLSPNGRVQTAGYLERHGAAFDFATAKGAGHEAPGFQPLAALTLLRSYLSDTLGDLARPVRPIVSLPASPLAVSQGAALAAAIARSTGKQ
jgi:hypothetical protein